MQRHKSRRFRLGVLGIALLAAFGLLATACSSDSNSSSGGTTKAAWIYVGPINDGGWTQAHNAGREFAAQQLGSGLVTTFKENVPEGPEVTQVINDLIKDGNTIIFATSYGYKDAMMAAAAANPKVKFEQATGDSITVPTAGVTIPSNYNEYWGAGEDTLYLSGMAAGAATKNNQIGLIAPFPIPEIIRHINAFTLGAQKVNPNVTVKVVWTKDWFNPTKERQAAESLVSSGVDTLHSHQDSPTAGDVAKANNIAWVGYDSDQSQAYSTVWLTTAVYNWGPYYVKKINGVRDGSWKQDNYYGTIADGFTNIAQFGSRVAQPTKDMINAELTKAKALSGNAYGWYWGEADRVDQAGTVQIKKGQTLTQKDLYTMSYFVKGVDGNPKG